MVVTFYVCNLHLEFGCLNKLVAFFVFSLFSFIYLATFRSMILIFYLSILVFAGGSDWLSYLFGLIQDLEIT